MRMTSFCCAIFTVLLLGVQHIAADATPPDTQVYRHPTRIAIFHSDPFKAESDDMHFDGKMMDLLMVELMHKPNVELVERSRVNDIMDEYSLTLRQSLDPEKAFRIGKMAGADVTIIGRSVRDSGKKVLWVKVIDNASGIIKAVAFFSCQADLADTLESLVAFAWAASTADLTKKYRKIIAIGGFEDQSINDQQMDRGEEIRRFLEQKYVGKPEICLVERAQMNPLLLELNLERMGLTATGDGANAARPAFTLVSGDYHVVRRSETFYIVKIRIELLGQNTKRFKVQGSSWRKVLRDIGEKMDGILTSLN